MTARRRLRPVFGFLGVVGFILVTWFLLKLLAGDPWRLDAANPTVITCGSVASRAASPLMCSCRTWYSS